MMLLRTLLVALGLVLAGLLHPGTATAAPPAVSASVSEGASARVVAAKRACTRNAVGKCIKRGQVCPSSKRGKVGWDNRGRKNVCRTAKRDTLRWQKPQAAKQAKPARRCDSNYSGACVPIASDVDCAGGSGNGPAYVKGPVRVVGDDIYDLDRDGDGTGCD